MDIKKDIVMAAHQNR